MLHCCIHDLLCNRYKRVDIHKHVLFKYSCLSLQLFNVVRFLSGLWCCIPRYLAYWLRTLKQKKALTGSDSKMLWELVSRGLVSMPTEFPLPLSDMDPANPHWTDYTFHNRLTAMFLHQLSDDDRVPAYGKLLTLMPGNVQLLLR